MGSGEEDGGRGEGCRGRNRARREQGVLYLVSFIFSAVGAIADSSYNNNNRRRVVNLKKNIQAKYYIYFEFGETK